MNVVCKERMESELGLLWGNVGLRAVRFNAWVVASDEAD